MQNVTSFHFNQAPLTISNFSTLPFVIIFLPFSSLSILFHPFAQLSSTFIDVRPLTYNYIHFHPFSPFSSSTLIHFYPLQVNHQASLHDRVTSEKSSAGFLTHFYLGRLVLLKNMKLLNPICVALSICQYNIWSCHSIEFPGFLHFSTSLIVSTKASWIFLR